MTRNVNRNPMDFGDDPFIEVTVRYQKKKYILREATGAVSRRHKNRVLERMETDDQGEMIGTRDMADLESALVADCLYEALADTDMADLTKPVPLEVVESWPGHIQSDLYRRAKEISPCLEVNAEATIDMLDRQIEALQARKEEMMRNDYLTEEDRLNGLAKNLPSATTGG